MWRHINIIMEIHITNKDISSILSVYLRLHQEIHLEIYLYHPENNLGG